MMVNLIFYLTSYVYCTMEDYKLIIEYYTNNQQYIITTIYINKMYFI